MGMSADASLAWGVVLISKRASGHYDDDVDPDSVLMNEKWNGIEPAWFGLGNADFAVVTSRSAVEQTGPGFKVIVTPDVPPTKQERELLAAFLSEIGWTGGREPQLLLMASYG